MSVCMPMIFQLNIMKIMNKCVDYYKSVATKLNTFGDYID